MHQLYFPPFILALLLAALSPVAAQNANWQSGVTGSPNVDKPALPRAVGSRQAPSSQGPTPPASPTSRDVPVAPREQNTPITPRGEPPSFRAACKTAKGSCTVRFENPPVKGTPCTCLPDIPGHTVN